MPDTTSASLEGRDSAILLAEQTIGGLNESSKPSTTKTAEAPIENGVTANESTVEQPKANKAEISATVDDKIMKVAVKHLEVRIVEQGNIQIIEAGSKPPEKSKVDKWASYMLCDLRYFDYNQKFNKRTLEIKSDQLKQLLKNIIGDYPGNSFKTPKIILNFPLRCLYHYLDEMTAELDVMKKAETSIKEVKVGDSREGRKKKSHKNKGDVGSGEEKTKGVTKDGAEIKEEENILDDPEAAIEHLEFFIQYVKNEFQETITDCNSLLPHGFITYEYLWAIFRPGMTIFTTSHGENRALKLTSADYTGGRTPAFQLWLKYVDYDGKFFGLASTAMPIYQFEGSVGITTLNAFPLSFHPKADTIKRTLIARGKTFEGYRGRHNMEYKAIALGEPMRCTRVQYNINGRVMVDAETYYRINPGRSINLGAFSDDNQPQISNSSGYDSSCSSLFGDSESSESPDLDENGTTAAHKPLTNEQCLLANFLIPGFALSEKKWVAFYVDKLEPVAWNTNVFDQLVLPASQKSLVKALVESHVREGVNSFDDIIKGKGKGLISILHGPPGVGKTLTAESVAEHTCRPLYSVSSGELGTNPSELEQNLSRILDVATVWKAVLLLDEADVFLEKRSLHDLKRNSLVSIFLRLLEYYQGILFLTSNRVKSFDEAFQSRIHVALRYSKLDKDARTKVWKNFMEFDDSKEGRMLLQIVAERELNGRQIKNCVRTARSLAEAQGKGVGLEHLKMVLDMQEQFEKDFAGLMDNEGDA